MTLLSARQAESAMAAPHCGGQQEQRRPGSATLQHNFRTIAAGLC